MGLFCRKYTIMKIKRHCLLILFLAQTTISHAQTTDTLTIQSKIFGQSRKLKIILPARYNEYPNTNRQYMVAFLFDAQSEYFFNVNKTTIDYLIAEGYLQPLIVVGIASDNRQYEFTPKAETEEGLKNFQKSGGADLLALHLKEEALPAIHNKYRCIAYTIGIGHSLGATFVTYSLVRFPELFNAIIAVSPNFHYDKEQMVHKFDSLGNNKNLNHKFLYMAYGFGDNYEEKFKPATKKMDSLLQKKNIAGLRWQVKSLDNDSHGTTALEGIFKGLVALNRQFTLSDDQIEAFYNDKSKPFIEHVKDYYKSVSDWAGLQLPGVDIINNMGYNCFYSDRLKEAIEVFQWGLSVYPDDINLYDSMGEIQQNTGDKKSALAFYLKGLAVVKKQQSKFDNITYKNLISGFEGRIKSLDNPK